MIICKNIIFPVKLVLVCAMWNRNHFYRRNSNIIIYFSVVFFLVLNEYQRGTVLIDIV